MSLRDYAKNTTVTIEKSRQELDSILRRSGAEKVMIGYDGDTSYIAFMIDGLPVKQMIKMPNKEQFNETEMGRVRKQSAALAAWEQACRQRMREHVVLLKAKLIACSLGFTSIKREFMADICLPGGETIFNQYEVQLDKAIRGGKLPALLPGI